MFNFISSSSKTPAIFVGDLTQMIFSKEEILSHSVTGQQCYANKDMLAKPALSPRRVGVIIGYNIYSFDNK